MTSVTTMPSSGAERDLEEAVDAGLYAALRREARPSSRVDHRDRQRVAVAVSAATNVTATQPAKATAAWPLGRPPRSVVPRPLSALTTMVARMTSTSATTITSIGELRNLVSTL